MTLDFHIPTHWNQLNEYQREKITGLVNSAKQSERGVYFAILYYLFCPNKWFTWKGFWQTRKFYQLVKNVPMVELLPHSNFIVEKLDLTKFPRIVKVGKNSFYGPADRLANISMEELAFTYKFYFDWMVNKSDIDLDRLVTILYRPYSQKVPGDVREPFSEHTLSERSHLLPKLHEDLKTSIGFAYKGSVDLIFSRYPELFPKPKKASQDKPKYQSMVPMMREMAMGDNQPLGDYEKVRKTNAGVFLDMAEETIKRAKQTKLDALKKPR